MKTKFTRMILAASLMIYFSAAISQNYSAGTDPVPSKTKPESTYDPSKYPPPSREGGENAASAFIIPGLPFNDYGNTCGHTHDHAGCWPSSTSPDLVYSYSPVVDEWISVSLCGSDFDTRLYAAKNNIDNYIAKGDDECNYDLSSRLACFDVHPGNIYYIMVSGWSGECGYYTITVSSCGTITTLASQPCAIPEGEPDIAETCTTNGVDVTNGGCGIVPLHFTNINIGDIYYGRCNIYDNGAFWDTDNYLITLTETKTLYWSAYSNFDMEINIIKGSCPPPPNPILQWGYGDHAFVYVSATLSPGTYYFRVKPATLMFGENEGEYLATLTEGPVSANPADWCPAPPVSVPLRTWAVGIAIILMLSLISFRLFRK